MSPLIIIAALLPVLVIVLGIDWVHEITTGELIAIIISSLIAIATLIGFIRRHTAPNRAYKMALFDSSVEKLIPKNIKPVREYEVRRDNLVEVHVRIVAKTGANLDKICFCLVKRGFPCWRWVAEKPRNAFVEMIWDRTLEEERAMHPYYQTRPTPVYSQENECGVLLYADTRLLKDDIMLYRVLIHANTNWGGYLEFCAPTGDNRRARCRQSITLQLNPDKKDSQT